MRAGQHGHPHSLAAAVGCRPLLLAAVPLCLQSPGSAVASLKPSSGVAVATNGPSPPPCFLSAAAADALLAGPPALAYWFTCRRAAPKWGLLCWGRATTRGPCWCTASPRRTLTSGRAVSAGGAACLRSFPVRRVFRYGPAAWHPAEASATPPAASAGVPVSGRSSRLPSWRGRPPIQPTAAAGGSAGCAAKGSWWERRQSTQRLGQQLGELQGMRAAAGGQQPELRPSTAVQTIRVLCAAIALLQRQLAQLAAAQHGTAGELAATPSSPLDVLHSCPSAWALPSPPPLLPAARLPIMHLWSGPPSCLRPRCLPAACLICSIPTWEDVGRDAMLMSLF